MQDVPQFVAALRARQGIAPRALEFLILTAAPCRRGDRRHVGRDRSRDAVWTIPGQRMKARREHRVPLSAAALALLKALPREDGNPHVFIGLRRPTLSPGAMMAVLERMGRSEATIHGFSSSSRTWAAERTNFPPEIPELALAHSLEHCRREGLQAHHAIRSPRPPDAAVEPPIARRRRRSRRPASCRDPGRAMRAPAEDKPPPIARREADRAHMETWLNGKLDALLDATDRQLAAELIEAMSDAEHQGSRAQIPIRLSRATALGSGRDRGGEAWRSRAGAGKISRLGRRRHAQAADAGPARASTFPRTAG